jgi:cytidylate kinase
VKGPSVVAISRQFGSGGARVGRQVAQRLGFQYADREILAAAARALNAETDELAPLEERVRGVWDGLVGIFAHCVVDSPFTPPELPSISESQVFAAERQIIQTLASHGRAVIVGRGAAHILRGRPDVIRVFLYAPFDTRVALAMDEYGFQDRREAEAVVRSSDAQRARFVRSVTNHDWCDASLYDICVNTATAGMDRAVNLIIDLVEHPADAADAPAT